MMLPFRARTALVLTVLCGLSRAGNVTIAERPQVGPFTTIQAAVDAALEGESLLVTPGTYAPFTIDAKSVQVFVTGTGFNDVASITGTVTVKNLAANQYAVLSRLKVKGPFFPAVPVPAPLEISGIAGHVRIQSSSFTAGFDDHPPSATNPGARVASSLHVVFSACTFISGDPGLGSGEDPVDAGPGVRSTDSSIAMYDTGVRGEDGSLESVPSGGIGGRAYDGVGFGLFASGCTFIGGRGGSGDYVVPSTPAHGGDALAVDTGQAHLLGNSYFPGPGGNSNWGGPSALPGLAINSLNGSFINNINGTARKLSVVGSSIVSDDALVQFTIVGEPGDTVYLAAARKPDFLLKPAYNGVVMVPAGFSMTSVVARGTIDASGTLTLTSRFEIRDGTVAARLTWLQALTVDASGVARLTGPAHVLAIE